MTRRTRHSGPNGTQGRTTQVADDPRHGMLTPGAGSWREVCFTLRGTGGSPRGKPPQEHSVQWRGAFAVPSGEVTHQTSGSSA